MEAKGRAYLLSHLKGLQLIKSSPPFLILSFFLSSSPLLFCSSTDHHHTVYGKMPKTRSNNQSLLHDDDCDITNEYSIVMDGAMDMRRKFSLVVSQARQLKEELQKKEAALREKDTALREKEAEIDSLTNLHQQELFKYQKSAEITSNQLRRQGRLIKRSRDANKELRRLNEEQTRDLDRVDHLRCNICRTAILNTVTKCGHVYCKPCLDRWREELSPFTCPDCRGVLWAGDFWEIHVEPDSKVSPSRDESDDATEVLIVDSDSE